MVKVWDLATGSERTTCRTRSSEVGGLSRTAVHLRTVTDCVFSPDGEFIVSAGGDEHLLIWDPATGDEIGRLVGHPHGITACAVSPDASFLLSTGQEGMLKIWSREDRDEVGAIPLAGSATTLALHPWKPLAVCGDQGGNLYLLDLMGIEYGPIVVTVVESAVTCPACGNRIERPPPGELVSCLTPGCGLALRINHKPYRSQLAPPAASGPATEMAG